MFTCELDTCVEIRIYSKTITDRQIDSIVSNMQIMFTCELDTCVEIKDIQKKKKKKLKGIYTDSAQCVYYTSVTQIFTNHLQIFFPS